MRRRPWRLSGPPDRRTSCANYTILSTSDTLRLDICAACHPFYTGQQRYVDTEGRIEKFKTKFGSASQAIARNKAKKQKPQGPSEASAEELGSTSPST